jgi:hypothetical protein
MIPPFATAATTAWDVQLAGVPSPITRVGRDVSTALASAGTAALPAGLPTTGAATADADAAGLGFGDPLDPAPATQLPCGAAGTSSPPHPASTATSDTTAVIAHRRLSTEGC